MQTSGIFAGCRVVFWDTTGFKTRTDLVKRHGGAVAGQLGGDTTHVIAKADMTAEEAARKLQGPTSGPVKRGCLKQGGASGASACQGPSGSVLPPGVNIVTGSWLSESIQKMQRQAERPFYTALQRQMQERGAAQSAPVPTALPPPPKRARITRPAATASASTPERSSVCRQDSFYSVPVLGGDPAAADGGASTATSPASLAAAAHSGGEQQMVTTSPFVAAQVASLLATGGTQPVLPAPEDICSGQDDWGAGRRWLEPWDDAAARQTLEKLQAHWHRRDLGERAAHPGAAAATAAATSSACSAQDGDALQQDAGGTSGLNGVCEHVACVRRPFCIVAELQLTKALYRSKRDVFQIKAIDFGIRSVEACTRSLESAEDVAVLQLGRKTADKVIEVMATGRVRRNEARQADPRLQVLALFENVWGVGDITADRWYHAGCRTLDDVRQRADLTNQQRLGLLYYDDFLQRIPRDESAAVELVVRGAMLSALEDMTGLTQEQLQHKLHVRVAGSYSRGVQTASDVDFVLAPPPVAGDVHIGSLLRRLLDKLAPHILASGTHHDWKPFTAPSAHALTREASAGVPEDESTRVNATWLGVWRSPGGPLARRVDFKLYAHSYLPYALNYFVSSMYFCRALRYWCNTPLPEVQARARGVHPHADAFKLSDLGMWAVRGTGRTPAVVLEPPLQCRWETDIFQAVGLDYVPPHMRGLLGKP